jgi:hypothetical protein
MCQDWNQNFYDKKEKLDEYPAMIRQIEHNKKFKELLQDKKMIYQ